MSIVSPDSLARTLDRINETQFFGQVLSKAQRREAAEWIAARAHLPGSYRGMPAPTASDFARPFRVFTGEKFHSHAGTACKLGFEATRALVVLEATLPAAVDIVREAREWVNESLKQNKALGRPAGMYCCASCSCAMWRFLAAKAAGSSERLLAEGMRTLRTRRTGDGRWRTFPFFYTLLALSEIDLPRAVAEMRHAAPVCERYLRRPAGDKVSARRRALSERVLERC